MKGKKYVAFLRGINVGGHNIIRMADLKKAVEACGFREVSTYIQSGNVLFESDSADAAHIASVLEKELSNTFSYRSKLVVVSQGQLKDILSAISGAWDGRDDMRRYIAFIKEPVTAKDVLAEVKLREGVDSAVAGKGVLYMATLMSGITKSGFTKLVGTKVYKDITIRNYNTAIKILALMERGEE